MKRVFIATQEGGKIYAEGDSLHLEGEASHHLARVLRAQEGEKVCLLSKDGWQYEAKIEHLQADRVDLSILAASETRGEAPYEVELVQGFPKGEKWEWILQKSTELGVKRLLAVPLRYSVNQIKWEKLPQKKKRWERIVEEASRQCGRSSVPVLDAHPDLDSYLATLPSMEKGELRFLAYEKEEGRSLKSLLQQEDQPHLLRFVIGPEGGFAPEEVSKLEEKGFVAVGLGPRILRTETAGLAVLSALLYEFELNSRIMLP